MTDETTSQEALAKSYDFANCLITLNLQIFPEDDSVEGRQIVIGIRNHQDPPIIKSCRSEDFTCGVIPQLIDELLAELKADLPNRLIAAIERDRVAQIEAASKQNEAIAPAKPDTKGKSKKSKLKSALPTIDVEVVASETVDAEQTKLNLFG